MNLKYLDTDFVWKKTKTAHFDRVDNWQTSEIKATIAYIGAIKEKGGGNCGIADKDCKISGSWCSFRLVVSQSNKVIEALSDYQLWWVGWGGQVCSRRKNRKQRHQATDATWNNSAWKNKKTALANLLQGVEENNLGLSFCQAGILNLNNCWS